MKGWQTRNGWGFLQHAIGGWGGLIPHQVTVGPVVLAASPDGDTQTTGSAQAIIESDSDFYVLSASVTGYDPTQLDSNAQLGYSSEAWPDYWDATCVVSLEGGSGLRLSDQPAHVGTIFGGQRQETEAPAVYYTHLRHYIPREFVVPWILPPGVTLRVDVSQRYTTAQTAYFTFHGFKRMLSTPPLPLDFLLSPAVVGTLQRYRDAGELCRVEPFFYSLNYEGADRPVLNTETATLTVSDADFCITDLTCALLDPDQAAEFPAGGFFRAFNEPTRLVVDQGDFRLDGRPFPLNAYFGTGREPGRLPTPLVMPAGSTLTSLLTFGDFNANDRPLRAYLGFHGIRIFTSGVL